jgi:hypothetical protein
MTLIGMELLQDFKFWINPEFWILDFGFWIKIEYGRIFTPVHNYISKSIDLRVPTRGTPTGELWRIDLGTRSKIRNPKSKIQNPKSPCPILVK